MNEKITPLGKFQKDLDSYLGTYSTIEVVGEIEDQQAFLTKVDVEGKGKADQLVADELEAYLHSAYGDDYLIISYDPLKKPLSRFEVVSSYAEVTGKIASQQDLRLLMESLSIRDFPLGKDEKGNVYAADAEGPTAIDPTGMAYFAKNELSLDDLPNYIPPAKDGRAKQGDGKEASDESKVDRFKDRLTYAHDNDDVSLDIAAIEALVNAKDLFENKLPPILFLLKNFSLICKGKSGDDIFLDDGLQKIYANLFSLEKSLDEKRVYSEEKRCDALILELSKDNDAPAWLSDDTINKYVKTIRNNVPNRDLREQFIKAELLDERVAPFFSTVKDLGKYIDLTAGYSIRKIDKFFSYIIQNGDRLLKEGIDPAKAQQVIFSFESGAHEKNPWYSADIFEKVASINKSLKSKLMGQDEPIDQVTRILESAVVGVSKIDNEHAPQAILFLAGPTGTGKTETCKMIAEKIFGSAEKMHRFDMSEYEQEQDGQKLIGAPPGYVGYDQGGLLTNLAMSDPFSMFLFDEVEKANPKIFDKFLQLLSDGRMTDNRGRTVSFENAIIVFTSNQGILVPEKPDKSLAEEYRKAGINPDFINCETLSNAEKRNDDRFLRNDPGRALMGPKGFYDHLTSFVKINLDYFFKKDLKRPEIYGRLINGIVVYNFISNDAMQKIVASKVKERLNYYETKKYFSYPRRDEDERVLVDYLVAQIDSGGNRKYGGRGVNMDVDRLFSSKVAAFIVQQRIKNHDRKTIGVSFKIVDGEIVLEETHSD